MFPRRPFSFALRIFSTVSYFEAGCMSRRDYFGCQIYNFDILTSPILPLFAWENIQFYIYFWSSISDNHSRLFVCIGPLSLSFAIVGHLTVRYYGPTCTGATQNIFKM